MIKGDFEFTKFEDGSYNVKHTPTGRELGRMTKAGYTWESVPPTEHYSGGNQLETATAMLYEIEEFGALTSEEPENCPYRKTYGCKKCSDDDCPLDD